MHGVGLETGTCVLALSVLPLCVDLLLKERVLIVELWRLLGWVSHGALRTLADVSVGSGCCGVILPE